jgi:hypothetical protein
MNEPSTPPTQATRQETNEFLNELGQTQSEQQMRERVFSYGKAALDRIVRRLYTDALKSPSQKRGELPTTRITGAEGIVEDNDKSSNEDAAPNPPRAK